MFHRSFHGIMKMSTIPFADVELRIYENNDKSIGVLIEILYSISN